MPYLFFHHVSLAEAEKCPLCACSLRYLLFTATPLADLVHELVRQSKKTNLMSDHALPSLFSGADSAQSHQHVAIPQCHLQVIF